MRSVSCLALVTLSACSLYFNSDDLVLEGEHFGYVVSELRIPTSNLSARENGIDLNGDKTVDNQLGMVLGTLAGQGLGVGDTAQEALLRGGLIMLADLQTTSFETTGISGVSGFTTFLGGDPTPPPCTNPDDLSTCGQHLRGNGAFSVDPGSSSGSAVGPIDDRQLTAAIGDMPVEIVVDELPLRLDLRHARIHLSEIAEDHISAVFAGAISPADVQGVIIPEATAQIQRIVSTECNQPDGIPPCGCVTSSRAKVLEDLFDTDPRDCTVTISEVGNNPLVKSLLLSDLRFGEDEFLSFGVGIELVRATFTPSP